MPRPPRLTAAAVVVPAALLLSLPFESLFNLSLLADTPGLIPLIEGRGPSEGRDRRGEGPARARRPGSRLVLRARAEAVGGGARSDRDRPLPRVLLRHGAEGLGRTGAGHARLTGDERPELDRQDDRVRRRCRVPAHARLPGRPAPTVAVGVLESQRAARLPPRRVGPERLPGDSHDAERAGRLVTAPGTRQPKYVVTAPGVDVDGKLLASTPRLALFRVSSPLRLDDRSSGLTADGWTGADATYTRYYPGAKLVLVELSRPELPVAPAAYGWSSSPKARPSRIEPGSRAATRRRPSASGLPRLRSRCESTSRRPSRLRSSGSPTHASSECARRSGRCRGDEQGANAARQGPPPDQPDLLDGRGARRDRRALGRGRAREGRERGLAGPLLAVVRPHRSSTSTGTSPATRM